MATMKYSKTEQAVFDILKKRKQLTAQELIEIYYGDNKPFYPDQSMRSVLYRLARKLSFNNDGFAIQQRRDFGQRHTLFILERVPQKQAKKAVRA